MLIPYFFMTVMFRPAYTVRIYGVVLIFMGSKLKELSKLLQRVRSNPLFCSKYHIGNETKLFRTVMPTALSLRYALILVLQFATLDRISDVSIWKKCHKKSSYDLY